MCTVDAGHQASEAAIDYRDLCHGTDFSGGHAPTCWAWPRNGWEQTRYAHLEGLPYRRAPALTMRPATVPGAVTR